MRDGGIIALVDLNDETDGALNADMMRILGAPLDMCHAYGWHNIADLARHLDQGSAVYRALNKAHIVSDSMLYDAMLLISDYIAQLNHNYCMAHGAKGTAPKRIKRPWDENHGIGKGAIPINEFESWYYGEE